MTDVFYIDSPKKMREIFIYDAAGRLVFSQEDPGSSVNVKNLSQGFYTVVASDAEYQKQTVSFVK